jgi:DNA-binding response OmpR family regulator
MIVIVDDDRQLGPALVKLLAHFGWQASWVQRGQDALSRLREVRPRLILLDLDMPEMPGMDVLQAIRADGALQEIPVLIYTSHFAEAAENAALAAGAQGFVVKGRDGMQPLLSGVRQFMGAASSPLAPVMG